MKTHNNAKRQTSNEHCNCLYKGSNSHGTQNTKKMGVESIHSTKPFLRPDNTRHSKNPVENKAATGWTSVKFSRPPDVQRCAATECHECGSLNIVEDWRNGHDVCHECGLVLRERIVDVTSEQQAFQGDHPKDDHLRVSSATDELTELEMRVKAAQVSGLRKKWTVEQKKLHITNLRDITILRALEDIELVARKLSVHGAAVLRAKEIFKVYVDHLAVKAHRAHHSAPDGRMASLKPSVVSQVVAGSMYLGCRVARVVRSVKDVMAATELTKKQISGIIQKMTAVIPEAGHNPTTAREFAERYATLIGLSREQRIAALEVTDRITRHVPLAGSSPVSLAAVAVYIVCSLASYETAAKRRHVIIISDVSHSAMKRALELTRPILASLIPETFVHEVPLSKFNGKI